MALLYTQWVQSRAPQGARGLKPDGDGGQRFAAGRRAPQGARGLKPQPGRSQRAGDEVAPRKGRVD